MTDAAAAEGGAIDPRIDRAIAYLELGRCEESRRLAGEVLAGDPDDLRAALVLGWALVCLDLPLDAIAAFDRAVVTHPIEPEPLRGLAHALLLSARPDQAVRAAEHAVRLAAHSSDCHATLALALSQASKYKEAVVTGRVAVELDPHNIQARLALVGALHPPWGLPPESRREAEEHVGYVLSQDPNNSPALTELARLQEQQSLFTALGTVMDAAAADPTDPIHHKNVLAVLSRVLFRAQLVLLIVAFVATLGHRIIGVDLPFASGLALAGGVFGLVTIGYLAWRIRRALGPRWVAILIPAARRNLAWPMWLGMTLLASVGLLILGFLPLPGLGTGVLILTIAAGAINRAGQPK